MLNLTEFFYTPGAVEALLKCCDKSHEVNKDDDVWEDEQNMPSSENVASLEKGQMDKHARGKSNPGQPSIVSKFPTIVDVAAEYVKQNGFSAQCRRRAETWYSSGVTVEEIREHLLQEVPGLKEHGISVTSTRRLFQAPNKGNSASSRYQGLVDARVRTKSNQYREFHQDSPYLFVEISKGVSLAHFSKKILVSLLWMTWQRLKSAPLLFHGIINYAECIQQPTCRIFTIMTFQFRIIYYPLQVSKCMC